MNNDELWKLAQAHIGGKDGLPKNPEKGYEIIKQLADGGDKKACASYAEYALETLKNAPLCIEYAEKGGVTEWSVYATALLILAKEQPQNKTAIFEKCLPLKSLVANGVIGVSAFPDTAVLREFINFVADREGAGALAEMNSFCICQYVAALAEKAGKKKNAGGKELNVNEAENSLKSLVCLENVLADKADKIFDADTLVKAAKIAEAAGEIDGAREYLSRASAKGHKLTEKEKGLLGIDPTCLYGADFANWAVKEGKKFKVIRYAPIKHSRDYAQTLAAAQLDARAVEIEEAARAKFNKSPRFNSEKIRFISAVYELAVSVNSTTGDVYNTYTTTETVGYIVDTSINKVVAPVNNTVERRGISVNGGIGLGVSALYVSDEGKTQKQTGDEVLHISNWQNQRVADMGAYVPSGAVIDAALTEAADISKADAYKSAGRIIDNINSNNRSYRVDEYIKSTETKANFIPFYYFSCKSGDAEIIVRINANTGGFAFVLEKANPRVSPSLLFEKKSTDDHTAEYNPPENQQSAPFGTPYCQPQGQAAGNARPEGGQRGNAKNKNKKSGKTKKPLSKGAKIGIVCAALVGVFLFTWGMSYLGELIFSKLDQPQENGKNDGAAIYVCEYYSE